MVNPQTPPSLESWHVRKRPSFSKSHAIVNPAMGKVDVGPLGTSLYISVID